MGEFMGYQITIGDYSSDWALMDRAQDPRTKPGYLSREEVIDFYGSLGIHGVELNHSYWYDYTPAQLRRLTADAGLSIVAYTVFIDLAVPSRDRQRALDQFSAMSERTVEIGSPRIYVIPVVVKSGFSLDEQRGWLIENLQRASERAGPMGLTIIAENIDYPPARPLMGRGADCGDICAQVGSPAFRLTYDAAASVFVGDDSLRTLEEMSAYIGHVHLKNLRPLVPGEHPDRFREADDGKRYTGTTLDSGIIPIETIVRELKRLGYTGFLQIEYQGEDDPRVALRHNVEHLRDLLQHIADAPQVRSQGL
jgi:sugar phosphate isomerase/epimerase